MSELVDYGAGRIEHLKMIQNATVLVEWLALAMKVLAVILVSSFIGFEALGHPNGGIAGLVQIGVFGLLICLWLSDANYRATRWAYTGLFEHARLGKVEQFDMNYIPFKSGASKVHQGLFTPHSFYYAVLAFLVVGKVFLRV